jgi:hypothetical protein
MTRTYRCLPHESSCRVCLRLHDAWGVVLHLKTAASPQSAMAIKTHNQ